MYTIYCTTTFQEIKWAQINLLCGLSGYFCYQTKHSPVCRHRSCWILHNHPNIYHLRREDNYQNYFWNFTKEFKMAKPWIVIEVLFFFARQNKHAYCIYKKISAYCLLRLFVYWHQHYDHDHHQNNNSSNITSRSIHQYTVSTIKKQNYKVSLPLLSFVS